MTVDEREGGGVMEANFKWAAVLERLPLSEPGQVKVWAIWDDSYNGWQHPAYFTLFPDGSTEWSAPNVDPDNLVTVPAPSHWMTLPDNPYKDRKSR